MSVQPTPAKSTLVDISTPHHQPPILVVYRLDDGREVRTHRNKGWCYSCNEYCDIEAIEPSEYQGRLRRTELALAENLAAQKKLGGRLPDRLRNFKRYLQLRFTERDIRAAMTELKSLLTIAASRQAGPRCLRCWSDRTAPIHFRNGETANPLECKADESDFAYTTYLLNVEGELLGVYH